jgi:hypothetical protein
VDVARLIDEFHTHFHLDEKPPIKWDWNPLDDSVEIKCVHCGKLVMIFPPEESPQMVSSTYKYKGFKFKLGQSVNRPGFQVLYVLEGNGGMAVLEEFDDHPSHKTLCDTMKCYVLTQFPPEYREKFRDE